jgi:hypothetical protein
VYPNDYFFDNHYHLNPKGRRVFSEELLSPALSTVL